MTTIAFDGHSLAADRFAICGGVPREVPKLQRCGPYIYGGCGDIDAVTLIAEWLSAGAEPKDRPCLDEGGVWGIVVDAAGRPYFVEGKRPVLARVLERFCAAGSGRDFAISAMAIGMSAPEAVQFAARFDVSTGDDVDTMQPERARNGVGDTERPEANGDC